MHNFEVDNDIIIKSPTIRPYATAKLSGIKFNLCAGGVATDGQQLLPIIAGLVRLAGQRPKATKATESVAAFKIRKSMEIGAELTLRGKALNTFFPRLRVILPKLGPSRTRRMGVKDLNSALTKADLVGLKKLGGAHLEYQFKGEG